MYFWIIYIFLKNFVFLILGICVKEGIKLFDVKGNFINFGGYEGYLNDIECR